MTLSAIIFRFEGVVALTSEVYRRTLNDVLAEAGFDHALSEDAFAKIFGHSINRERFFEFAEQSLHPRKQTEDLRTLFKVTYKRLSSLVTDAMLSADLAFGSSILELLEAARQNGVPTVLVSAQKPEKTEEILGRMSGGMSHSHFDVVVRGNFETEAACTETISSAASLPLCAQGTPLVIEACGSGLAAAQAAGAAAIAVIGHASLNGGLYGALAVVDVLDDLCKRRLSLVGERQGERILSALRSLAVSSQASNSNRGDRAMQVLHILKSKGSSVKSMAPGDSVDSLVKRLADEKVGAMVVLSREGVLEGIVSERDVAQGLSRHGSELLKMPVSNIMTRAVITCAPNDSLLDIAQLMTNRRIRHLPVSEGGKLVGLISIGDVLGQRLAEAELEASVLRDLAITLK